MTSTSNNATASLKHADGKNGFDDDEDDRMIGRTTDDESQGDVSKKLDSILNI